MSTYYPFMKRHIYIASSGLFGALLLGCGGGGTVQNGPDASATSDGASGNDAETFLEGGEDAQVDTGSTTGVWRPFADSSVWNTPIASSPSIDPNSAAMIADFENVDTFTSFSINITGYSIPVYYVDSTVVPMVTVSASLGGTGFRNGAANDGTVPGTGPAPIPTGATPAAGTDKHLLIVDRTANMEWGFWNADDSAGWTAGLAATMDLTGSGVRPPTANNPWWAGQGARACGFPLIAGLITVDEVKAGAIEHALVVAYPHIESRYYTPPASSAQGTTNEAISTRGIMCGGHMQLDPTLDVTTLGLPPAGLMIARALQKYGAFVGDFSGAISLYADESASAQAYWSAGVLPENAASKIPLNRMRVLTLGTKYDNNN